MTAIDEQLAQARDQATRIVHVGLKDVTDYLTMARLVRAEPLQWCDAPSPKGRWRCIRAPHDTDWHVYGVRPS